MRSFLLTALVATSMAAVPVAAQTDATTTTTVPPRPVEFATATKGTLPDVTGRWLVLCRIDIPGGQKRTATALWEIVRHGDQPELRMPFAHLPAKMEAALDSENPGASSWEPSPGDLAEIAAAWDAGTLEPHRAPPVRLDTYFTARDAFDATFTSEPRTKDAQWVVQQTETFGPDAAPAVREVNVYAVLDAADGGWRGNYDTTLLAAAPFPIPINFKGEFRMIRLPPARRGVLSRIGDLFSGCGKR